MAIPRAVRRAGPRRDPATRHRGRLAAHAARARRPRALPRVRAAALRRRTPVPARSDGELESRGLDVELNRISGRTPACLFNSFNFDFARLRRFAGRGARMVHRVDGPIGAYRGFDDGTDARIAEINAELAAATIFQSRFSLEKHRELGLELRDPVGGPERRRPGDLPSALEP